MTNDLPIVKSIKMIRESDVVERLKKMSGKGDYYDDEYRAAIVEIERLREALRKIANGYSDEDGMRNIARQALGEKE